MPANDPPADDSPAGPTGASDSGSGGKPPAAKPRERTPPLPQLFSELRDLVVAYVRQQTLVPVKRLGRYIGFGIAGSLLLGFGVLFLGMSCLRALQTETGDTFSGDWSWVPYVITFTALVLGAVVVWLARTARQVERRVERAEMEL